MPGMFDEQQQGQWLQWKERMNGSEQDVKSEECVLRSHCTPGLWKDAGCYCEKAGI